MNEYCVCVREGIGDMGQGVGDKYWETWVGDKEWRTWVKDMSGGQRGGHEWESGVSTHVRKWERKWWSEKWDIGEMSENKFKNNKKLGAHN